jgi:hypothetical protein
MTIANFKPKEAQPITPQIWTDFLNHKNFDHVEQGEKAKLPVGPQAKKKSNKTRGGDHGSDPSHTNSPVSILSVLVATSRSPFFFFRRVVTSPADDINGSPTDTRLSMISSGRFTDTPRINLPTSQGPDSALRSASPLPPPVFHSSRPQDRRPRSHRWTPRPASRQSAATTGCRYAPLLRLSLPP